MKRLKRKNNKKSDDENFISSNFLFVCLCYNGIIISPMLIKNLFQQTSLEKVTRCEEMKCDVIDEVEMPPTSLKDSSEQVNRLLG